MSGVWSAFCVSVCCVAVLSSARQTAATATQCAEDFEQLLVLLAANRTDVQVHFDRLPPAPHPLLGLFWMIRGEVHLVLSALIESTERWMRHRVPTVLQLIELITELVDRAPGIRESANEYLDRPPLGIAQLLLALNCLKEFITESRFDVPKFRHNEFLHSTTSLQFSF